MPGASAQVVVVGGGIAGLSAAYDLAKSGVEHFLFEARPRVGGVIETRSWDGCVLECGPDSFLSAKPEALALIQEVGLESEVIGSNDKERVTYILRHGKLTRLPEGTTMFVPTRVGPMLASPIVGWGTKIRMGLELLRKPEQHPDRSVAEFVTDHFGRETLEYLAEPLLSGVYGGDPNQLSMASVMPRFVEMERTQGSLARAVMRSRAPAGGAGGSVENAPLFRSLRGGLQCLVDRLAARANVRQANVDAIERRGDAFAVRAGGDWVEASRVIVACPAWAASPLLRGLDPALADLLAGISYTSSAIVTLIYRAAEFNGQRAGTGFLVPRVEREKLMACTYVGTKFPHRVPPDKLALRCFFGGAGNDAVLRESDESLVAMSRDELRRIVGLTAAPIHTAVSRWPRSMAQYTVGHAGRVKEIEARAGAIPGLYLAGNAYSGIGIPDCIRTGRAAARAAQTSPR